MAVDARPRVMVAAVLRVMVADARRATAVVVHPALAAAIRHRAATEADRRMAAVGRTGADRTAAAADMGGNIALEFFPVQ